MSSYLEVVNVSKSYGPRVLFDHISFHIDEGDKIALVAPNGTGKTSLLSIIAGKDSSDGEGEVRFLKDIDTRFLRLPQDMQLQRKVDEYAGQSRPFVRQPVIAPTVPRNLKRVSLTSRPAASASAGCSVQTGQFIEHERFGIGEVINVEGEGDNAKATIRFQNAGVKQLLLRFARFKVINQQ